MSSSTTATQPNGSDSIPAGSVKRAVQGRRAMAAAMFDRLAEGSRGEPGITRDTYGAGENFGHRVFAETAREAGLEIVQDAAANT